MNPDAGPGAGADAGPREPGEARPLVIAIDGPSASGKSTTAREVAERLGFVHLNSGLLYRALTWVALRDGWIDDPEFERRLWALRVELEPRPPVFVLRIDGERPGPWLQSAEVTARVSAISARPEVREKVNRAMRVALAGTGLVIDGRDIGTAVFPDAVLKVFLTASPEERARRRLLERDETAGRDDVTAEASRLRERDRRDASRPVAPLARADDAIELDSTERARSEVVDEIVRRFEARRPGTG